MDAALFGELPADILREVFSMRRGHHYLQLVLRLVCRRFRDLFPKQFFFQAAAEMAASAGDLPTLKVFYEEGHRFLSGTAINAARWGHVHVLDYLFIYLGLNRSQPNDGTFHDLLESAVKSKSPAAVLWCLKNCSHLRQRVSNPHPHTDTEEMDTGTAQVYATPLYLRDAEPRSGLFFREPAFKMASGILKRGCTIKELAEIPGTRYGEAIVAANFARFYAKQPQEATEFAGSCHPLDHTELTGFKLHWDYTKILGGLNKTPLVPREVAETLLRRVVEMGRSDMEMLFGAAYDGVIYTKMQLYSTGYGISGCTLSIRQSICAYMMYNQFKIHGNYLNDWRTWNIPVEKVARFILSRKSLAIRGCALEKYREDHEDDFWQFECMITMAAKRDHGFLSYMIEELSLLRRVKCMPIYYIEPAITHLALNHNTTKWLSFSSLLSMGNPTIGCLEAALSAGIPATLGATVEEYKKLEKVSQVDDLFYVCISKAYYTTALWFYHNGMVCPANYELYWQGYQRPMDCNRKRILYFYTNIPLPPGPVGSDIATVYPARGWDMTRGPNPSRSWIPAIRDLDIIESVANGGMPLV